MSANINRFQSKKILMVVANPSVSTSLGWPVGFWACDLTHAWCQFHAAGHEVVVASPGAPLIRCNQITGQQQHSGRAAAVLVLEAIGL